jgi:hypothetical protein
VSICTRTGEYVDQISYTYADESTHNCGGNGGSPNPAFELGYNEYITQVDYWNSDYLNAVQFITDQGRVSPIYGKPTRKPKQSIVAPEGKYDASQLKNHGSVWQRDHAYST